jgi:hypothetical protein
MTIMPGLVGAFVGLFILIPAFFFLVAILGSIFWVYMLVHAATNDIKDKVVWIIVLVFTHLLGAIIYYYAVKRSYDKAHAHVETPPPADSVKTV